MKLTDTRQIGVVSLKLIFINKLYLQLIKHEFTIALHGGKNDSRTENISLG